MKYAVSCAILVEGHQVKHGKKGGGSNAQLFQGSYPFSQTNFQDFSRTFPGLKLIFQGLKNSLQPLQSLDLNINSPYCPPYTSYFLAEFNRFPGLSSTSGLFPGLSSPGKCQNKIPGLSGFSRARTNPVIWG